jgi:hypothetical protein
LDAALIAALSALDDVEIRHDIVDVSFGKFADPDAGYYFTLTVVYRIGNTVDTGRMTDRTVSTDQVRRIRDGRISTVVKAYTKTVAELAEREAAHETENDASLSGLSGGSCRQDDVKVGGS